MELNNEFRVAVPVADAWKVLTDVERIAPMLPGAQLQEVEGDEYRGVVKVKVGPITAQYKGTATFVEKDEAAGKVVLKATGRDTRGQGNASALITATMLADGDATKVTVATELTVTGKVAQFGRGVLADVSSKLIGQFVDALEADLAAGRDEPSAQGPATSASQGGESSPEQTASAESGEDSKVSSDGAGPSKEPTGPRRIDAPEAEPLDLLAVAGGSTMKRFAPLAVVVAVIVAWLVRRARRAGA
ncbi:MAG: SRPBCC family protein [Acidimicrobiales bacterium]